MKKFTIIAVALCVGFMLAVPAMALEVENDGYIRVRGFSEKGYSLDDNSQSTSSYYDSRLRVNTNFKVSDMLWVSTRFRAFNRTLGEGTTATAVTGVTITPLDITTDTVGKTSMFEWERAWMNVKTPIGLFRAGRLIGGVWGLTMFNSEGNADRIRLDSAAGPVKFGVILQKSLEGDKGNELSSADINVYYLYGLWANENFKAGLLYGYIDNKSASDQSVAGVDNYKALQHAFLPFFTAKFGAFGLQGELVSTTGTANEWGSSVARRDVDKDSLAYNLEGSFNFDGGSAYLGYVFASGQEGGANPDDTDTDLGDDWEGLFILAGSTGQTPSNLGGMGNFSGPTSTNDDGIQLIYAGADFKAGDAISLGIAAGTGKADEEAVGQDDDLGFEIDLKFSWKFYDGALKYSAIAAYLDAGDYWEGVGVNPLFDDSMYALYHAIQLYF